MRVAIVKVLVLTGMFILTFSLGLIPIRLMSVFRKQKDGDTERYTKFKRILSLLSCYAAGVFLSTCLLDLLPAVRQNLTTVFSELNYNTSYPVAEFIMSFGLFLILIIEQIVLSIKERNLEKSFKMTIATSPDDSQASARCDDVASKNKSKRRADSDINDSKPLLSDSDNSCDYESSINRETRVRSHTATSALSEHSISGISDDLCPQVIYKQRPRSDSDISEESLLIERSVESLGDHDERQQSTLRSLLLLVALSLHSVFEGLAVGLQQTSADVLGIFAALLLHKSILSFSLGMNLVQSKLSRMNCFKSILLFSSTSPFGIAVGIGIEGLWDSVSSNLVQGILEGIAAGTFLYVTFFEVLPHEFNSGDIRLAKLVFLILGFSTVAGVLFLN